MFCFRNAIVNLSQKASEETLGGEPYKHAEVSQWTKEIMDTCIRNLTTLKKEYKYIGKVNCIIFHEH